ncbi:MAG: hypothetical protein FWD16_05355, partial [Clostridia bacterium]|nr:hypothetical protein [Clostridia bacterium]
MLKKHLLCALCAVVLLLCCACGEKPITEFSGTATGTTYKGFFDPSDGEYTFGGDLIHDLTLHSADARRDGADTLISLKLGAGQDGNEKLPGVPSFHIESLSSPPRIVVWLEGIAWFNNEPSVAGETAVTGASGMIFSDYELQRVAMVFALKNPASYQVSYSDSTLRIRLRPAAPALAGWHVAWYAFDSYLDGLLEGRTLDEFGFRPCLADDLQHLMLVSKRYNTKKAAEEAMAALDEHYAAVVECNADGLPPYDAEAEFASFSGRENIYIGGEAKPMDVVTVNGWPLDSGPLG